MSRKPILFLATLLVFSIWGAAQNPTTPPATPQVAAQPAAPVVIGPAKLGFVNMGLAIATCDEGKREFTAVQAYVDQKSADLQKQQKELEALRSQLEIQGSKLTDDARATLADEIETKDTAMQRFQQDTQKDIDKRRQNVQTAIGRKLTPVLEKVAKEKGLNVVQFIDANIYGYIDPSLVVTEDVIKAYNQTYPVGAAAAPVKK
jgi:outer membrane protein